MGTKILALDSVRENGISCRTFRGSNGGAAEHFIIIEPARGVSLGEQINSLLDRYAEASRLLGLAPETAVFRRLFLSDASNQSSSVRASALGGASVEGPVAISVVQQPPLCGTKVALLAYHIEDGKLTKSRLSTQHIIVAKNQLRHLWSIGLCASTKSGPLSAAAQTRSVLTELINKLAAEGGTLRDNCVRTWIYLKNIDLFYQNMVDARRELFADQGMTNDSHFIASTGIEGSCAHQFDVVAMDAYSIFGLIPEQLTYLRDLNRLCMTMHYNVTFERGTRVEYSDRSHLFISGTASIDNAGRILYLGDVLKQLDRALGNIDALLNSGSASLEDMMYLLVYLRDPSDFHSVDEYLARRSSSIPTLILQGAVCRSGWLVEVEGIGIAPNNKPLLPPF